MHYGNAENRRDWLGTKRQRADEKKGEQCRSPIEPALPRIHSALRRTPARTGYDATEVDLPTGRQYADFATRFAMNRFKYRFFVSQESDLFQISTVLGKGPFL